MSFFSKLLAEARGYVNVGTTPPNRNANIPSSAGQVGGAQAPVTPGTSDTTNGRLPVPVGSSSAGQGRVDRAPVAPPTSTPPFGQQGACPAAAPADMEMSDTLVDIEMSVDCFDMTDLLVVIEEIGASLIPTISSNPTSAGSSGPFSGPVAPTTPSGLGHSRYHISDSGAVRRKDPPVQWPMETVLGAKCPRVSEEEVAQRVSRARSAAIRRAANRRRGVVSTSPSRWLNEERWSQIVGGLRL
ncbi:hypothetical protein J1614_006791 [Plenodomus biglobosus]|nr:hypothetical protein J1614_006791 [Plenodomus biglobosus]